MDDEKKRELARFLAPHIEPHLEAIRTLWKDANVSLVVRANELPDGNLFITTEDDPEKVIEVIRRRIDVGCTLTRQDGSEISAGKSDAAG